MVEFTTKFSYSPDYTINFKLKTPSKRSDISPDINIYRLGYYDMGRDGAIAWEC